MTGYIIGLVLGLLIFLIQNFKPTSFGFRVSFLVLTIAFLWGISYADLGYWNIGVIPVGVIVLCFIAAVVFPYGTYSAETEYMSIGGRNYFIELNDTDKIGKIDAPGFKQTYDRIIVGIFSQIVNNKSELQELGNLLYRENFYPISSHTKGEVIQHIRRSIEMVASSSRHGESIRTKAAQNIEDLFNAYVSVMSIHEESTRNIESMTSKNIKGYSIGETVVLPVEGEGDVEGTIIGYEKGFYQVRFPFAVSIMPAKEPEGGWSDNDWPDEIQLLSDGMIDEIMNGILIGTTVHYHF